MSEVINNTDEEQVDVSTTAPEADSQISDDSSQSEEDSNFQWFIIQCFSGHEYKVQIRINQVVEQFKWTDSVKRVLVPEEEIVEIKNNKRLEKVSKIYPGYVFIHMLFKPEVFFEIKKIPGVSKFIGMKDEPTPVVEDEILRVLRKVGDKSKKIDVDFETDEVIKIISGPFRGYSGPISDINVERGKLKALVSIFGRETPVELDFDQVEKTIK